MYCKICPKCKKKSYSATGKGNWVCPYCKYNLTFETLHFIESSTD